MVKRSGCACRCVIADLYGKLDQFTGTIGVIAAGMPSAVTVLIYVWARSARLFAQTTFVLEGENQWRPFLDKRLATLPN